MSVQLNLLLKKINTKYQTNYTDDTFIPYVDFDFKIHGSDFVIETPDDLDKVFLTGNISFLFNSAYEVYYKGEVSELSIVDVFYHMHQGMELTKDHHHRYPEDLFINIDIANENSFIVEMYCGS